MGQTYPTVKVFDSMSFFLALVLGFDYHFMLSSFASLISALLLFLSDPFSSSLIISARSYLFMSVHLYFSLVISVHLCPISPAPSYSLFSILYIPFIYLATSSTLLLPLTLSCSFLLFLVLECSILFCPSLSCSLLFLHALVCS